MARCRAGRACTPPVGRPVGILKLAQVVTQPMRNASRINRLSGVYAPHIGEYAGQAKSRKMQQNKDFDETGPDDSGQSGMNMAGTGEKIDAPLTRPRSLDVPACISGLIRLRPILAPEARPIAWTLIQQLKAWEGGDRTELRRTILGTVERLESPHLLKE